MADRVDLVQQLEALAGVAAAQQAQDLLEDPRRRCAHEVLGGLGHRRERLALDLEAEPARELDRAQDAHRVLAEAHHRIADGADHARLDVREAVDVVDDPVLRRVEEQRVDGEVPPQRVFFGVAELVVARDQQVLVVSLSLLRVAPEGRALEDLGVAVEVQVRELEAAPDDAAVARKGALDLLRPGLGRDVVVLGGPLEQQVAHAAAHEVGLVALVDEARDRAHGVDVQDGQVVAGRG